MRFFNDKNQVTKSPPPDPFYDLINIDIRNVNIHRIQRKIAGYVYGGSSTDITEQKDKTTLDSLSAANLEDVDTPQVYSILYYWTEARGGGVSSIIKTNNSDAETKAFKSLYSGRNIGPAKKFIADKYKKLLSKPETNLTNTPFSFYPARETVNAVSVIKLIPPHISDLVDTSSNNPPLLERFISNINTIGIARHDSAMGSGVLTLPSLNWVHDKMLEDAKSSSWTVENLTHAQYNKLFFKTYMDNIFKKYRPWKGKKAIMFRGEDNVYNVHFGIQTCKKLAFDSSIDNPRYNHDPLKTIKQNTTITHHNLSKKDVLEHLEAMANNIDSPGKHPDPDIEDIYKKIDQGLDGAAKISDFGNNIKNDKSIFWLLLRILSFICANVDDGQDPNKPYKECTRKYLLETIVPESSKGEGDIFRRLMMVNFNMNMFRYLFHHTTNGNGKTYFSVYGHAFEDLQRALFRSLELFSGLKKSYYSTSCNKFKYLLSTIIPFISSSAGNIKWGGGGLGDEKQMRRSLKSGFNRLATFDFTNKRKASVGLLHNYVDDNFANSKYDNSLKYWQHNDLGFSCKLMENLASVHVNEDPNISDYPYLIPNWNHPDSRCGTGKLLTLTHPLTKLMDGKPLGDYCTKPSYKNGRILLESSLHRDHSFRFQNLEELVKNPQKDYDIFDPYTVHLYSEEPSNRLNEVWRYKRSKRVCGEPVTDGDDPCDPNTAMKDPVGSIDPSKAIDNNKFLGGGTTPNPNYNPVNPWSNIGNIGKIAKLIEMHRKVIKAVAEFEDRQIKINLQKRFLLSCSAVDHKNQRVEDKSTGNIMSSAYLDMRQEPLFDSAFEGNTEYFSRHPEANLAIEPAWQELNLKHEYVSFYGSSQFSIDPSNIPRKISPSGYPYHEFPDSGSYVSPAVLDDSPIPPNTKKDAKYRFGKFGIHYRAYPRTICTQTTIDRTIIDNLVQKHDESFCKLKFGQVHPHKNPNNQREDYLNFARDIVNNTLKEMADNYRSKTANPVSTASFDDEHWCNQKILNENLEKIVEPYRTQKFNGKDIYIEKEVTMKSFRKCLCNQEMGISYRN